MSSFLKGFKGLKVCASTLCVFPRFWCFRSTMNDSVNTDQIEYLTSKDHIELYLKISVFTQKLGRKSRAHQGYVSFLAQYLKRVPGRVCFLSIGSYPSIHVPGWG